MQPFFNQKSYNDMKDLEFRKYAAILIMLAVVTAGCNKNANDSTIDSREISLKY